jgi:glycosidase
MEFHIRASARRALDVDKALFKTGGNVVFPNFYAARVLADRMNASAETLLHPDRSIRAGQLNAMGLIDEILHYVVALYREAHGRDVMGRALAYLESALGKKKLDACLLDFVEEFPSAEVYSGAVRAQAWLEGSEGGVPHRELALEELLLLWLANENPAFKPFSRLFDDSPLKESSAYARAIDGLKSFFEGMPRFGPDDQNLVDMLRSPAVHAPYSLPGQLDYMRTRWGLLLGPFLMRLLASLDFMKEEERPGFAPGPGPSAVVEYSALEREYERFSPDKDWMPRVVMIAKSTLVWLSQLSEKYGRDVRRLDQIPDEELDALARAGFNTLWLIGLWERSPASRRIKEICGNPEAAASAYSLSSYQIAGDLGGWDALASLRERCAWRGLRLAADMVPNHTGIDSDWVMERPELFIQSQQPPFPGYTFNWENLSSNPRVGIYLEDHYFSRSDAAVVFKRVDFGTGATSYIYHGNDGTGMPWNDTAQIDFLKKEAREAVIQEILHVARNFPVIRFDAAMVLAKRHFRRLWYPEPGSGGDIPSRAEHAMTNQAFNAAFPEEFWREVVDRCAKEAPDTLLLAEAFWMMEGYFVRTLGMHRVYNSAFMNMLKREENAKYRSTIKNTQEFDPDILKRFVNFMNNPDEETAVAQFGKGDKYFGVCTMMVTMPGLPMFGHGQVEGFEEKYGMEYRRAYWKEVPDAALVERHEREIFPLMKRRYLFSGSEHFRLYDLFTDSGAVDENVFAYSNRSGRDIGLVLYNNRYESARGWIRMSAAFSEKLPDGSKRLAQQSLADAFGLGSGPGRYCLMHEQRSGLWFLRSSDVLREKGLFIMLGGYQCQVFLDIHEALDDERGHLGMLERSLNGAGVRDIRSAILEIALKELYEALAALYSVAFFEDFDALRRRLLGGKAKKGEASERSQPKAFIARYAPKARAFYALVASYFQDAGLSSLLKARVPGAAEAQAAARATAELLAIDWEASMTALFAALKAAETQGLEALLGAFQDGALSECLAAFAALTPMRLLSPGPRERAEAVELGDYWCLDRKLREALSAAGVGSESSWRLLAALKAAYARSGEPDAGSTAAYWASILHDESGRSILGVNAYGGVLWFNREAFEAYACAAALIGAMAGKAPPKRKASSAAAQEAPRKQSAARLAAEADAFLALSLRAMADSGFKVEALVEGFKEATKAT